MGRQPEGRLSREIIKMISERGGFAWKVHGNEYTPAGLPDVVGVLGGVFVAFETKMVGNDLAAIQVYRIRKIRAAGGLVCAPCFSVAEAEAMLDLLVRSQTTDESRMELMEKYGRLAGRKSDESS